MPDSAILSLPPATHRRKLISNNRGLTQAYEIRDFAATEYAELSQVPTANLTERLARTRALRDLAGIWSDAMERIRIARGKPMPGSLRPEPASKSKRRLPSVLPEPVPE